MHAAQDTLELVVDVADPLDLLVDLAAPAGAFLPCAQGLDPGGCVTLRVRLGDKKDALRVGCVVVPSAAPPPGEVPGVRVRFPNANVHALALLRAFAPILAERPPTTTRQKVALSAGDATVVRALASLAKGGTVVVPTDGVILPGERIALTVGDAWALGVLMVPLLALEAEARGAGYAARAKLLDPPCRLVVGRFLERVARAIAPREPAGMVV